MDKNTSLNKLLVLRHEQMHFYLHHPMPNGWVRFINSEEKTVGTFLYHKDRPIYEMYAWEEYILML